MWCSLHILVCPILSEAARYYFKLLVTLFLISLVIRPKVILTDAMSRRLEVPREHTTRCTPHLAGYSTGPMPQYETDRHPAVTQTAHSGR